MYMYLEPNSSVMVRKMNYDIFEIRFCFCNLCCSFGRGQLLAIVRSRTRISIVNG